MRLQLYSDLHLEAHPDFIPQAAPGADALVLAGDIGSYRAGSQLAKREDAQFGLARFSPKLGHWPVPVFYVPGNHEYDGLDFPATRARLAALCEELGIWLLDGCTRVWQDVRFVGCTLWADFDALAVKETTLAGGLKAREKAERAADFWLKQSATTTDGALFDAQALRAQCLIEKAFLEAELGQPFAGKTVVITHFAPSLLSTDPRYGLQPGTAGFCNSFDDLLPRADLWLHGHLHHQLRYRVGRCLVVANPLGYRRKGEQEGFDPLCCVDVHAEHA